MNRDETGTMGGWMDYLFQCVQRYVHRYGFRMVQASGTLNQMYVSVDEARRLLSAPNVGAGSAPQTLALPEPEAIAAALQAAAARLLARTDGPVHHLQRRFRLTDDQTRLLVAAAGPLLSMDISRLYPFAWADFAVKLPSVGFLCELLADHPRQAIDLQAEFRPESPLVRYRLVELRDAGAWGNPSPILHRGVVVSDGVVQYLRNHLEDLPPFLRAAGGLTGPEHALPIGEVFVPPRVLDELRRALAEGDSPNAPRPFLIGPPGVGRRTTLAAVAAEAGRGVLSVDLARLAADRDHFEARLAEASREALLRGVVLLLRGDTLFDERDQWEQVSGSVSQALDRYQGPVVITGRTSVGSLHRAVRRVVDLVFTLPGAADQRALWQRALAGVDDVAPGLATALGSRFTISPGTIYQSVAEARDRRAITGTAGPLTAEMIARAVRHRLDHTLSQVAEPFSTSLTWDDVVFPKEVMEPLEEILSQARHRERVYDQWGFRRKMSYGRGLACLFCGPPGTGKTMVAALIAQTLGRELYKVDISRIVSKWIGETEKNLARVFDEAERAQVILLFDEADSLFSSRTEVKGSNDRFANMEINYLLQRMESYDGMSLLTTNFEKSIDEAFKRRLKFKVDFPMPEAEEREMLWRVMLPDAAEITDDIRYDVLAKKYKLAGGHIKNAVLRAAFYAAEAECAISHALLEKAAIAESRELGRLL